MAADKFLRLSIVQKEQLPGIQTPKDMQAFLHKRVFKVCRVVAGEIHAQRASFANNPAIHMRFQGSHLVMTDDC